MAAGRVGAPALQRAGAVVVTGACAVALLVFGAAQGRADAASSVVPLPRPAALQEAARFISGAVPPGIVRAVGTHFVLDGKPWRFVGYDDYRMPSLPTSGAYICGDSPSDSALDTEFSDMAAAGVTVVRTWFFQSYVAGGSWRPFDRILTDAKQHGIRVIPVLSNEWGTCETYNGSSAQYKPRSWYVHGYMTQLDYGMPLTYEQYAIAVAQRYRGDPTIAFWQLMNEAEDLESFGGSCNEDAASAALRSFADRMTNAIKAVDPYHLVSLGTIGGTQCGANGDDYARVNGGAIDICEYHDYEDALLTPQVNRCAAIGKPLFAGERGFLADLGSGTVTPATLAGRAVLFARDVREAFVDDGCQGYLVWSWTQDPSGSYDVGPRDPTRAVMTKAAQTYATPAAVYAALSPVPSGP